MDSKGSTSQVIDQYFIDLLGLQDEYELSWEDYFRALREASIAARMNNTKYTSEQAKLIAEELKRVKEEDKSTRFSVGIKNKKVNAKKITSISTFVQKQKKQSNTGIKPTQNLLPPPKEKKDTVPNQKKDERISLLKLLQNIDKTLGSILKTLENGLKFDQKTAEENRKSKERLRRSESENKLEGGLGKGITSIIGAASKALSPLQDVFDRIKNFIVWVLLGKAFRMFMQWFNDPANQKTFNTIVKFLGDHWLLLVGSYLMFGNSLGRLITKLIGKLAVFTVKMGVVIARKLLPLIGKLGGRGKLGLAVAGGLAVAAGARALTSGKNKSSDVEEPSKEETAPISKPKLPSTDGFDKGGIINSFPKIDLLFGDQSSKENENKKSIGKFESGGVVKDTGNQKSFNIKISDEKKETNNTKKFFPGLNIISKALEYSPLGVGLKGASDILKNGILKSEGVRSQLKDTFNKAKESGILQDPKLLALGGIPGLIKLIAKKTTPEVKKNVNESVKTGGYNFGGVVEKINSGLPITGAGKDNTLIKAKTGDAVLTERDQNLLSSTIKSGGQLPFNNAKKRSTNAVPKVGQETTIAVRKGEALVTPEQQRGLFEKYGINIPQLLSGRKPNKVDSDKIKTKNGIGFSNGGVVSGFAQGGVVGGTSVLDLGKKMSGDPDHKSDPTLAQSIPLLYRMLQSGRFKEKGWGDKKFMDQLTARLLVESKNFSRAKEMYNSDPRDPKGKEGYQYFSGYSGMIGNKNADDAYNFRGRGAIQLTGRDNYQGFNKWLARNGHKGVDVVKNPDLLSKDPKVQALSTLYYLEDREKTFGVNFADMAKKGDSKSFTYNINGGYNHLAETQDNLRRIQGLSGGVNYGKGFAPAAPKPKAAPRNPIMDIASKGMSAIGNIFAPPASAAPKPKAAPKSAAPKPKRWAIDPRGWVGKKDGGIIEPRKQSNKFDTNIRQNKLLGNHVDRSIDQSLPFTMADYLEQQQDNDIPIAPITPEQIQEGRTHLKNKSIHNFLRYNSKMKGGGIVKKQGGGLSFKPPKNMMEILRELYGIRSNSLERRGRINDAYGLRASKLTRSNRNFTLNNIYNPNKNPISAKFNSNVGLNVQQPKKQSISDTLKELREMRARSLDRQGKSLDAVTLRASNPSNFNISKSEPPPPSIDSATNLPIKTTTDAPPPPKIDTPPIQKKAGGGIIKKISSGIGGFFNKNKKRDIVKKAISKTVSKGDSIKGNVENYTNKSSEKRKGFWGGIHDTVSSINSGVNMAKGFIKKVNPIKSAKNAANFIGGNVKKLSNVVGKKGSDILSAAAQNPKMIKIGGAFGKFGGRMVPGLGVAASAADAAARAERGDKWGAALAGLGAGSGAATIATSGAAATGVGAVVPAVAEAVSMGADISLLGKDIWDILSSKENKSSGKNKIISNNRQKNSLKNTVSSKVNMMQGGGIIKLQGGGIIPTGLAAPPPPLIDTATNLPIIMTTNAPSSPTVTSPFKPTQPKPSTSLAPIKKSMMQRQADELRTMRANSLERQGRTSESYGQRAFGTGKDFSSFFAKGMVMENTGMNIPGGTADRQLTALQPGEYVVPKNTVDKMGKGFLDSIVGSTDSNSAASKIGIKPNNVGDKIKPYSFGNGKSEMIKLPPIKDGSGAGGSQNGGMASGTKEVMFDAQCVNKGASIERQRIMDTLGFITHI